MLLRSEDHDRLVAEFESDRAMGVPAAPVRDELTAVAKLAAGLGELSPAARFILAEQLKGINLEGLFARADTIATRLTKRMKKGGRRTIAQVMGNPCPRVRLLHGTIAALAKDAPNPRPCEILLAATQVLDECGVSAKGLDDLLYKLPENGRV